MYYPIIVSVVIGFVLMFMSIKIVPEQEVWILQRLGRFRKKLLAGAHIISPFVDSVAYKHNLKEELISISAEDVITKDGVFVELEGVLYIKVLDPIAASYSITNLSYAIKQLAQTILQLEIGKIRLDEAFVEIEHLNSNILKVFNKVASNWGVQCTRYEIKGIIPSEVVRKEMDSKRVKILESEGHKQSQINHGEAHKRQFVLASDAAYVNLINRGRGEAEAILKVSEATAKSIEIIAKAMKGQGAKPAAALNIAERSFEAISKLIKEDSAKVAEPEVTDVWGAINKFLGALSGIGPKLIEIPKLIEKKVAAKEK